MLRRPWPPLVAAFLAFLASLPFFKLVSVEAAGQRVTPADLLFALTFGLWVAALLAGRATLRRSWFYAPLAAYALAMAVSALFSASPRQSGLKLLVELYLISVAVLTFNLAGAEGVLLRAVRTWLGATVVTVVGCLTGIVLFYLGVRDRAVNVVLWNYGSLPPGNYPRLNGFFLNGNMLCNYLVVSGMLALYLVHSGRLSRAAFAALAVGIAVTALFTFSPGLGGLAVAVGIWAYRAPGWTAGRFLRGAVLGVALVSALAFLGVTSVSTTAGTLQPSSRALVWMDAFRTFRAHPLLGQGVGTKAANVAWRNPSGVLEQLTEAHNVWLSVGAQEGTLGLLAFGSLVAYLCWRWRRHPLEGGAPSNVALALGAAFCGALLYQGLTAALEDTRHVWVLVGLFAAATDPLQAKAEAATAAAQL